MISKSIKWPLLSVAALSASVVIAGCDARQSIAPAGEIAAKNTAPAGSSAEEAQEKSEHDHSLNAASAMKADTHTTKMEVQTSGAVAAGRAATWTLKISDVKSGAPVNDFAVVHDKLMHLIVVSRDLKWFNHLHPTYKGKGVFTLAATLPRDGSYKMYADYTPKGRVQEVAQHPFEIGAVASAPVAASLVPDKMKGAWMTRKVTAHPEGEPERKGGATYEVALMPMPMPLQSGKDVMLHFQIRDAKGRPIKDLQPYLGALGHCVILSQDTTKYLHSHPMEGGEMGEMKHDMGAMKMEHATPKSGGPDVMFHTNFPTAGIYKAWGQFMHKGRIITAPFVMNVGAAKPDAAKDAAVDESQPHSH